MAWFLKPPQKYVTLKTGNTLGCDIEIERKLEELIPGLRRVQKEDECDHVLVLCPVVSRAGTDIQAAMNMLSTRPDILKPWNHFRTFPSKVTNVSTLLVLHHTFDTETVVPDSSRATTRMNTLAVDCLFHEDCGFHSCSKNKEALDKVANWIDPERLKCKPRQTHTNTANESWKHGSVDAEKQEVNCPFQKYFIFPSESTFRYDSVFEKKLQDASRLEKVQNVEDCDFVLVFSRTNIEPQKHHKSPAAEISAVEVVLHQPVYNVPHVSIPVISERSITVHVLFCKDQGLLNCPFNDDATDTVIKWLFEDTCHDGPRANEQMVQRPLCKYVSGTNNTEAHLQVRTKLQEVLPDLERVHSAEHCHFHLEFCGANDIDAARDELQHQSGNKPALLIVLHTECEIIRGYNSDHCSQTVGRDNLIKVDCFLSENEQFLPCSENNKTLKTIADWINSQPSDRQETPQAGIFTPIQCELDWKGFGDAIRTKINSGLSRMRSGKDPNEERATDKTLKSRLLKYFTLRTGNMLGHEADVEKKLQELIPGVKKVQKLEECDFILVVCPFITGNDVEAALKMLSTQSGSKPAVLMVFHHTFDPDYVVPDSGSLVNRENMITVDCLFHEDHRLLQCKKNFESFTHVSQWIKTQVSTRPPK